MSEECFRCGEPVLPGEAAGTGVWHVQACDGEPVLRSWHRECAMRSVTGSVGHLRGLCHCFGGSYEDPPGMTKREAAKAAVEEWERQQFSPLRKGCS